MRFTGHVSPRTLFFGVRVPPYGSTRPRALPTFTIINLSMHRTFVKWLFATYLLGSGTVWSILILPLFPFVGRGGGFLEVPTHR